MIGGFIVGELVALLVALALLWRDGHVTFRAELRRVGLFLAICASTVAAAWMLQDGKLLEACVCAAATLMIAAAIYASERATFETTWTLVMKRLRRA